MNWRRENALIRLDLGARIDLGVCGYGSELALSDIDLTLGSPGNCKIDGFMYNLSPRIDQLFFASRWSEGLR